MVHAHRHTLSRALFQGRSRLVEVAEAVLRKLKKEVEEKDLKLSITGEPEYTDEAVGSTRESEKKRCNVRSSLIKTNRIFRKTFLTIGVRKLLRTGLVLARAWAGQAVGVAPTERKN